MHRLRASGVPIRSSRDGYLLEEPADSPLVAVRTALRSHPVVALWGPLGVGKTTLLRRLAGSASGVVHLEGIRTPAVRRRLAALAATAPRTHYLDGVESPEAIDEALDDLVRAGHAVVFAMPRPPAARPGRVAVACGPWSSAQLARTFPGRDTQGWDGLPIGACDDASILARLPREPALAIAAHQPDLFHGSVLGAACERIRSLGLLVGEDLVRLPGPIRRALRSRWTDAEWRSHVERVAALVLALVDERRHPQADSLRVEALGLLEIAEARGLGTADLLIALHHARWLEDPDRLRRATEQTADPEHRGWLLYQRWMLVEDPDDALLRRAIAESPPALANELAVELAYHVHARDPEECFDLLDAVARWLDEQPAEAHLWTRNERMVTLALLAPDRVELADLREQYLTLERRHLAGPVPRMAWMLAQCLYALGRCALVRDELHTARVALERVMG